MSTRRAVDDARRRGSARSASTPQSIPQLVLAYGVDVVYGSNLKDVEAVARSFDSQIQLDRVNAATLTGRTPLDEVRTTLARLTIPRTTSTIGSTSSQRRRCCRTASTSTG